MDQTVQIREGDIVRVSQKVSEGKKERIVPFRGIVLKVKGSGMNTMFTVRQTLEGIHVERIFPLLAPSISKIEIIEEKREIEKTKAQRKSAAKKSTATKAPKKSSSKKSA